MTDEQNGQGSGATPASGGGGQGWSEGGPSVDTMSVEDAKTEIQAIENSPVFRDPNDKTEYWATQRMLHRRDSLYRHSLGEAGEEPHNGMEESLQKQGITKETLEADHERFADQDEKEARKKAMDALSQHFGGEDQAKQALGDARAILKRFATADDLAYLDETGIGSDPNFIKQLAEIGSLLKRGGKK